MRRWVGVLAVAFLGLTAASDSVEPAPIGGDAGAQRVSIYEEQADDPTTWGYRPDDLTVAVGSPVTWHNDGDIIHTVTADDESFDSGDMAPGDEFTLRFDRPGEFSYHCTPHPWMTGRVRVVDQ